MLSELPQVKFSGAAPALLIFICKKPQIGVVIEHTESFVIL